MPVVPNLDSIEYDFEDYALTRGIPETLDPLPYRKSGSVFGTDNTNTNTNNYSNNNNNNNNNSNENENDYYNNSNDNTQTNENAMESQFTSAKHDPRLRTVVCRHWLRDLCMKGAACEFLHQYDLSKMPLCRHGERCKITDCPFRHISEEQRMECAFYKSGFCIHGPFCRYKHVQRPRSDLPVVADFSLGLSQMQSGKDGEKVMRRPAPKPNEFYKISLCKHFMNGECPFGEGCHFAHGEAELRAFPRANKAENEPQEMEMEHIFGKDNTTVDYYQGGASGGGKPCPILDPELAKFFIVAAATQRDLAISTKLGAWYVQAKHAQEINNAYKTSQVLFFFTVTNSQHIQGAAIMTSSAEYQANATYESKQNDGEAFCYRLSVEWFRTTEFPISTALEVAPDLLLPTKTTQLCQNMSWQTGESIMKAVWNSPLVTLYESWTGDSDPPAPENLLTDFRAPEEDEIAWPVFPGPGYIFGCSEDTMDECLGRGIFGLPAHMIASAKSIQPGATIFLFNVTDRLLFGIFEALTPATLNIEPTAFSKNPKATSSPFPVQIRVRVSLECPPLEDTDPIFNDILRARGQVRSGPLTHAQAEAVATLLANQCGALQYMKEYQQGLRDGAQVRAPPIALPPRKIGTARKETQVTP